MILFSETRAKEQVRVLDGGHMLYTVLGDNPAAGVAILLHAKHVRPNNKLRRYSDRVAALAFRVHGRKLRAIAVYMPHASYTEELLGDTYDQLRAALARARRANCRPIVGGDFNAALGVGRRGALLHDFAADHELVIANASVQRQWADTWAFESSMGVRRRIDYILVDARLDVMDAIATHDLDLGSDHRAVRAEVRFAPRRPRIKATRPRQRGWQPHLDTNGRPSEYHHALDEQLQSIPANSMRHLEQALLNAASRTGTVPNAQAGMCKPWLTARVLELQDGSA